CFFFSSRRRHTRFSRDWSSDVCSSDLEKLDRLGDQSQAALTVATEARDLAAEAVKLSKLALEQSRGNGAGIADLIDSLHRVSQRVDVVGKGILTLGASLSELRQLFGEESEYTRERFQELNATGTDPPPKIGRA